MASGKLREEQPPNRIGHSGRQPDIERDRAVEGKKKAKLKSVISAEISLLRAIERATEVFGDRNEAMRWMGTPVRALNYVTPISILSTSDGAMRVEDVLGRMEHGVW